MEGADRSSVVLGTRAEATRATVSGLWMLGDMRLTLPRLRDRVYSDFLMGSRLRAYRRLLEAALRAGDQISSVGKRDAAHQARAECRRSCFFRLSTIAPEAVESPDLV